MNHGYCKNCWWWKAYGPATANGICYMQNGNNGPGKETEENDYCPDYINRKKKVCGMKSVDEFIASLD